MNLISRKEAISKGLVYYFTGKPCKHGHVATRYVSSQMCYECHKANNKAFATQKYNNNEEHRESVKQYQRDYRESDPEHYKLMTERRPGNTNEYRERVRQRSKQHYLDNRERYLEKSKQYHKEHYIDGSSYKAKFLLNSKQYVATHKAWKLFHTNKRRAQLLNASVSWADDNKILALYEEARRLTKETGLQHHVDHCVPLQGKDVCGLHWEGNLQILTARENLKKSNKLED